MDDLLDGLRSATIGDAFNLYAGDDGAVRLANLRHYLHERAGADVVALGEAAGYQGMRWTGIAFTSERDLARWGPPYRATSGRPNGWSEPSGTIVNRGHHRCAGCCPVTSSQCSSAATGPVRPAMSRSRRCRPSRYSVSGIRCSVEM